MSTLAQDVKTFVQDVFVRALHTAWQAGAATAFALWTGSGLQVKDLASAHGLHLVYTVVVVGVVAAVLSSLKTMLLALRKSPDFDEAVQAAESGAVRVASDVASGNTSKAVSDAESAADVVVKDADQAVILDTPANEAIQPPAPAHGNVPVQPL